jgi:hypothetical protein
MEADSNRRGAGRPLKQTSQIELIIGPGSLQCMT